MVSLTLALIFALHYYHSSPDVDLICYQITRFTAHYKEQSLNALYKVLLWGDLLGSPLGLLGNVGTGVYDFVTESAQGLETGAIVDGIAKVLISFSSLFLVTLAIIHADF